MAAAASGQRPARPGRRIDALNAGQRNVVGMLRHTHVSNGRGHQITGERPSTRGPDQRGHTTRHRHQAGRQTERSSANFTGPVVNSVGSNLRQKATYLCLERSEKMDVANDNYDGLLYRNGSQVIGILCAFSNGKSVSHQNKSRRHPGLLLLEAHTASWQERRLETRGQGIMCSSTTRFKASDYK